MKALSTILLTLLALGGCVSLEQVVNEELRVGMTKEQFCEKTRTVAMTTEPCYSHINNFFNLPYSYYSYLYINKTEILGANGTYFVFKNVRYKVIYPEYPPKNGGSLILITRDIERAREAARVESNNNVSNTKSGGLPNCKYPANSNTWHNCYGEMVFDNGKFSGNWKNNNYSKGTYTWHDGRKYVGEFKERKLHGLGTHTWPSGDKYVGEHEDNKVHGQGTYTWHDGRKYVGEFKERKLHGLGTHTWPNGDKYVGEYEDDERQGQGTYTWANGDKYLGEFKESKLHGLGTYTPTNGDKYVGEYEDDEKQGQGTYTWANGDKYVGEYEDNEEHGQGTQTWASGEKYVGEYKEGLADGSGIFTSSEGETYSGNWVKGKRTGETQREKEDRLEREKQELNRIELEKQKEIELEKENKEAKERRDRIDSLYQRDKPSRELTLAVQELLIQIGYSVKADGKTGINTKTAIKAFQEDAKINPINGNVSESLLVQLQRFVSKKSAVPQINLSLYEAVTSGSGLLVNKEGYVVTNEHVISECSLLTTGKDKPAILVKADSSNDIAIIKTSDTEKYIPLSFSNTDPELGEKIFVAGYPLNRILENLNFTSGSVSAEAGFLQNINEFQFTAPIQPGNSGGPILNEYGGVVGIAVSTLATKKFEDFTESLVQNINYGIKKSSIEGLMKLAEVEYEDSNPYYFRPSNTEVAQLAKTGAILIKCWKKK